MCGQFGVTFFFFCLVVYIVYVCSQGNPEISAKCLAHNETRIMYAPTTNICIFFFFFDIIICKSRQKKKTVYIVLVIMRGLNVRFQKFYYIIYIIYMYVCIIIWPFLKWTSRISKEVGRVSVKKKKQYNIPIYTPQTGFPGWFNVDWIK